MLKCRIGSYFEDRTKRAYHPFLKGFDTHWKEDSQVDIEMWYIVVQDYSRRALTYISDKLAAIAGLVNKFEEQGWCKEYIAGLWKEDLLRGLLWSHGAKYDESDEDIAQGSLDTRFPSWSWASSDSNVRFSTGMAGSFGRVQTAFHSKLEAAHVTLDDESKAATKVEGAISFEGHTALLSSEPLSSYRVPGLLLDSVQAKYGKLDRHGELDRPTRHPCWMVRMATYKYPRTYRTSFLLLEVVHEDKERVENQYRRVGTLRKEHHNSHDVLSVSPRWENITII